MRWWDEQKKKKEKKRKKVAKPGTKRKAKGCINVRNHVEPHWNTGKFHDRNAV